jgi:chromosome segregation ATPase
MAEPVPVPAPIPRPRPAPQPLALPRRRAPSHTPFSALDASVAARESIMAVVAETRSPIPGAANPAAAKLLELERTLKQLEVSLTERERVLQEAESRLAEHERDLAEMEALLFARSQLLDASLKAGAQGAPVSAEERAALNGLRQELDRQEATIKEHRQSLAERERFLDDSETKLFEKVQAQQEKEIELDQREEDLRAMERRLRERDAVHDPAVAAALVAEDERAKQRDEFNE